VTGLAARLVRMPRARASVKRMAVPEGSCSGTEERSIKGSQDFDREGRLSVRRRSRASSSFFVLLETLVFMIL
jgi:hypothetical protein